MKRSRSIRELSITDVGSFNGRMLARLASHKSSSLLPTTNTNTKMIIKDILLEKVQVACSQRLTKDFLMEAKLDTYYDEIVEVMEMRLKAYIWATPEKSFEHSNPATAWQHFKLEYFPRWLLKKFPVKLIKTVYSVREVFPEYKVLRENASTMWLRTAKLPKFMPM